MSVKINNLKFRYNKNLPMVLNDISLEIPEGTITVLLGLNGCGKTTLIKSLAGLFKTIQGEILYENSNVLSIPVRDRSKLISYVSQKHTGIDDVLVKDYLTYSYYNQFKFYQTPNEDQKARVLDYAKLVNVDSLLDKKMGELSGGERQLVCICAALIQDTKYILLDEPTSALDLKNQNLVLKTLKEIAANDNKTIILSSHNPNHALLLDSNVVLINGGKILKEGSAKDIINVENLKQIYGDNICLSKELKYDEVSFR